MVGLEIWSNGDRFNRTRSGGTELGKFRDYRNEHLISKFHHDNAQFLRYIKKYGLISWINLNLNSYLDQKRKLAFLDKTFKIINPFSGSEWWWDYVAGMAFVTAMCGGNSAGINKVSRQLNCDKWKCYLRSSSHILKMPSALRVKVF